MLDPALKPHLTSTPTSKPEICWAEHEGGGGDWKEAALSRGRRQGREGRGLGLKVNIGRGWKLEVLGDIPYFVYSVIIHVLCLYSASWFQHVESSSLLFSTVPSGLRSSCHNHCIQWEPSLFETLQLDSSVSWLGGATTCLFLAPVGFPGLVFRRAGNPALG